MSSCVGWPIAPGHTAGVLRSIGQFELSKAIIFHLFTHPSLLSECALQNWGRERGQRGGATVMNALCSAVASRTHSCNRSTTGNCKQVNKRTRINATNSRDGRQDMRFKCRITAAQPQTADMSSVDSDSRWRRFNFTKAYNTYIAPQAAYRSCSGASVSQTEREYNLQVTPTNSDLQPNSHAQPWFPPPIHVLIWITIHLPTWRGGGLSWPGWMTYNGEAVTRQP